MIYVEIKQNVVRGVFDNGIDVLPVFCEQSGIKAVEITDLKNKPSAGDLYNPETGEFTIAPKPDRTVDEKLDELAAFRYRKETGGITLPDGTEINTDDRSQFKIARAYDKSKADATYTTKWKANNGWVEIDAATIITIGDAVFDYVDACFTREAELAALIESDPDTDITTGWPV